jgi:hypothetical protein
MNLTIENLEKCFQEAINQERKYVAVKIEMQGFEKPEIIINRRENFQTKLAYYKKAYNENLTLKTFNGIKIVGFTYGDYFDDIESDLT